MYYEGIHKLQKGRKETNRKCERKKPQNKYKSQKETKRKQFEKNRNETNRNETKTNLKEQKKALGPLELYYNPRLCIEYICCTGKYFHNVFA